MGAAGPYAGRTAVLATRHRKQEAFGPVLAERLGLVLVVPDDLDTDALGTFTGDVPRRGTMLETAIAKARLGMAASGLPLGLASEGSYGPNPALPFVPQGIELAVLVDDERGIVVAERNVDDDPVFAVRVVADPAELETAWAELLVPGHAVTVAPHRPGAGAVARGVADPAQVVEAVRRATAASEDGRAVVQTDMRAHVNPTRMLVLGRLAERLARRLATACPGCGAPGFGLVRSEAGLPCADCGAPSVLLRHEVHGCAACSHAEIHPRADGLERADPGFCVLCNP